MFQQESGEKDAAAPESCEGGAAERNHCEIMVRELS